MKAQFPIGYQTKEVRTAYRDQGKIQNQIAREYYDYAGEFGVASPHYARLMLELARRWRGFARESLEKSEHRFYWKGFKSV